MLSSEVLRTWNFFWVFTILESNNAVIRRWSVALSELNYILYFIAGFKNVLLIKCLIFVKINSLRHVQWSLI